MIHGCILYIIIIIVSELSYGVTTYAYSTAETSSLAFCSCCWLGLSSFRRLRGGREMPSFTVSRC